MINQICLEDSLEPNCGMWCLRLAEALVDYIVELQKGNN